MLANRRVPDSQTAKIKTAKISETRISAYFAKICTRKNYQPYSTINIVQTMWTNAFIKLYSELLVT